MTWTSSGYRYAPCVVCKVARQMGILSQVKDGRCLIHDVGDVCSHHYHLLKTALTDDGGASA